MQQLIGAAPLDNHLNAELVGMLLAVAKNYSLGNSILGVQCLIEIIDKKCVPAAIEGFHLYVAQCMADILHALTADEASFARYIHS